MKRPTRQQQKPTPLLQKGLKRRASSNFDQDGSRKRRKAAQLEENQLPEVTNGGSRSDGKRSDNYGRDDDEDEDMDEDEDGDRDEDMDEDEDRGRDEDEDQGRDENEEDKDGNEEYEEDEDEDEDEEDEDEDDEDEDDDEDEEVPPIYDTEIPGIPDWDLLGEDFEREAAALGLYFSCMNYLLS